MGFKLTVKSGQVLSELLSKQQELRDLVEYNRTQLGLLYDTALMVRHSVKCKSNSPGPGSELCSLSRFEVSNTQVFIFSRVLTSKYDYFILKLLFFST